MPENWKPARKKPVEVEYRGPYTDPTVVETIEGAAEVDEEYIDEHGGYVIVRGVDGEVYPCALDIFYETHETPGLANPEVDADADADANADDDTAAKADLDTDTGDALSATAIPGSIPTSVSQRPSDATDRGTEQSVDENGAEPTGEMDPFENLSVDSPSVAVCPCCTRSEKVPNLALARAWIVGHIHAEHDDELPSFSDPATVGADTATDPEA